MSVILQKSVYAQQMRESVEPYLSEREQAGFMERRPGQRISVFRYRTDMPEGVVVISHGFTENAEKYKEMVYYFLRAHYHVWLPEHCGHGYSYRLTKDPSLVCVDHFERYVEDFLYVARKAAAEYPELPLYLFGHSMGGGIAAAAAAREPKLFARIVLSSPMIRPRTGDVPFRTAQRIARYFCRTGRSERYVIGQHPYHGIPDFAGSCGISAERFAYYQEKRAGKPRYHLNAASYGWLQEAGALNRYLQREAWRKIEAPLLLFQAERDALVSKKEQERFVRKLAGRRRTYPALIEVPGTRHEIFNSEEATLKPYLHQIFSFFQL